MVDYHIDNEGSGFDIEVGQDLNSLMNAAKAGEAPEDNIDTNWLFEEGGKPPEKREPEPQPEPEPEAEVQQEEEQFFQVYEQEPAPEFSPATDPAVEPEPVEEYTAPEPEPVAPSRVHLVSAKDELGKVTQIVNVLNAYRELNAEEQGAVSQFVTGGTELDFEPDFIVAVLNADPTLGRAMTALKEAKALEPVDRAFYVIELPENLIYYLGNLISVFTEEVIDRKQTRGQYSKALVRSIEKLDGKSMNYVHATASVLEAAAPVKN